MDARRWIRGVCGSTLPAALLAALTGCGTGSQHAGAGGAPSGSAGAGGSVDHDAGQAGGGRPNGGAELPDAGDPDAAARDAGADPRYVVASVVSSDAQTTTYLSLTPTLGADAELSLDDALEVPGYARLYGVDGAGWFAVGSSEQPSITRYELGRDGRFVRGAALSLASRGVTSLGPAVAIVSDSKAYYLDMDTRRLIDWDPSQMLINGSLDLPSLGSDSGESLLARLLLRDGQLLIFAGFINWDTQRVRTSSTLVIVDVTSDEVVSSSSVEGCALATSVVRADGGDIYVGSELDAALYHAADASHGSAGCMLRLAANGATLDAPPVALASWSGTSVAGGLLPGPDGSLLYQAYDANVSPLPAEPALTARSLGAWRLWGWAPGQASATQLALEPRPASGVPLLVDGAGYVTGPGSGGPSSTQLFETTASVGLRPGLVSPGLISGAVRLR